ncbi:hypothetical protein UPYG_G00268260 [Umbra pygmaea]|uniref:Uromodulin-like n=1 Tax=Umbra pygmaea TaxID=75934 RepID=A0ABD0WW97_UMBPY
MALKFNLKMFLIFVLIFCCACDGVLGICNVTHCTDTSKCLKSPYKSSCQCTVGYFGDLCDKDATINVTCGKDHITIMVIEDYFQYYNVPVELLHLKNQTCHAHREVISGIAYYAVRISKDQYINCGGKPLEKTPTTIAYTLTLLSAPQIQGNITRDRRIKIEYTCIYPYKHTVSLHYPVNYFSRETVIHVSKVKAKVVISLYKDELYRHVFGDAPVIHLQDNVHVEVTIEEPRELFDLRVDECWATESPEPDKMEGNVHTLLLRGCVNDETVVFHNEPMGVNGNGSTTRYSFKMFRFIDASLDLYLHCKVHLCTPEERCIPECKSKTKREAALGDSSEGLVSYGPIKIEMPDQPKYNLLMMMVPVAVIWVLGFFLLALVTIAKAGNKRMSRPAKC